MTMNALSVFLLTLILGLSLLLLWTSHYLRVSRRLRELAQAEEELMYQLRRLAETHSCISKAQNRSNSHSAQAVTCMHQTSVGALFSVRILRYGRPIRVGYIWKDLMIKEPEYKNWPNQ